MLTFIQQIRPSSNNDYPPGSQCWLHELCCPPSLSLECSSYPLELCCSTSPILPMSISSTIPAANRMVVIRPVPISWRTIPANNAPVRSTLPSPRTSMWAAWTQLMINTLNNQSIDSRISGWCLYVLWANQLLSESSALCEIKGWWTAVGPPLGDAQLWLHPIWLHGGRQTRCAMRCHCQFPFQW